jgi:hypothetical protein
MTRASGAIRAFAGTSFAHAVEFPGRAQNRAGLRRVRRHFSHAILHSVPRRGVLPVEEGSTSIVAGLVE